MTLRIYDSSGLLVFEGPAGSADAALADVTFSSDPWDPAQGPLVISHGSWSHSYDGVDSSQAQLRNGVYLLVLESQDGSKVQKQIRVLGAGSGRVSLIAGPNPVVPRDASVLIRWSPITKVELRVYALDSGLVRDFGTAAPPVLWDLRNAAGNGVAGGIYLVAARIPGERVPQFFKLMVVR